MALLSVHFSLHLSLSHSRHVSLLLVLHHVGCFILAHLIHLDLLSHGLVLHHLLVPHHGVALGLLSFILSEQSFLSMPHFW